MIPIKDYYLQQLCTDTGCSLEDLPDVMDDRDKWQERPKEISESSMTRWWYLPESPTVSCAAVQLVNQCEKQISNKIYNEFSNNNKKGTLCI